MDLLTQSDGRPKSAPASRPDGLGNNQFCAFGTREWYSPLISIARAPRPEHEDAKKPRG
jgi:hypothetical protein